jgi:gluconolactonase
VVRYNYDGSETVIADNFEGKRLNSPNDAVVAADHAIWFTDPPYGIQGDYEGSRAESELPNSVYRVDPANGRITKVTDEIASPNGLCFSPDQSKLYVADTGKGREIKVWDVDGGRLSNGRRHAQLTLPGSDTVTSADGIRCDVDGNIWAGARPGVQVISPVGDTIGVIRLPEVCANVCFGGARRNRLFMTASQSLYSVYVGVRGAGIA